ncbi:MAG: enoyl-CoA hydratase-related protein, partial [Burkholderiales bacterium]
MSEDVLLVEKHPEGYAVLTLNRPESLNAWSVDLCTRFRETFAALQEDDQIRVLILTGSGPAFCAGLDVKEMRADPDAFFKQVRANSPGATVQAGRKPLIGAI